MVGKMPSEGKHIGKWHDITVVKHKQVLGYEILIRNLQTAHTMQGERRAYAVARLAIGDFLNANRVPPVYAYLFAQLASALTDLDDGIVQPLLVPTKASNRTGLSSGLWRRRAFVALGMK